MVFSQDLSCLFWSGCEEIPFLSWELEYRGIDSLIILSPFFHLSERVGSPFAAVREKFFPTPSTSVSNATSATSSGPWLVRPNKIRVTLDVPKIRFDLPMSLRSPFPDSLFLVTAPSYRRVPEVHFFLVFIPMDRPLRLDPNSLNFGFDSRCCTWSFLSIVSNDVALYLPGTLAPSFLGFFTPAVVGSA